MKRAASSPRASTPVRGGDRRLIRRFAVTRVLKRASCPAFAPMPAMTRRRRRMARLLWVVLAVVVIIGSLLPADSAPMRALDELSINDKLEHVIAYLLLALLPAIHERRRILVPLLPTTLLMGILLEFGQLYSPGRSFDVYDMLADGVGVLVGTAFGLASRRLVVFTVFQNDAPNLQAVPSRREPL